VCNLHQMYMLKRQMCVVWIKDQKIFNTDRAATSSTRKYGGKT
jgi:hypothetical protein